MVELAHAHLRSPKCSSPRFTQASFQKMLPIKKTTARVFLLQVFALSSIDLLHIEFRLFAVAFLEAIILLLLGEVNCLGQTPT